MQIVLHAHGGGATGVGHVMRALTLAEEAVSAGHEVLLAGEIAGDFLRRRCREVGGLDVEPLTRGDVAGLRRLVERVDPDVVHLDTYDDVDLGEWRGPRRPLLSSIEDGGYGRRAADLLVDPNLGAEGEPRPGAGGAVLLRGVRFAPIRRSVTGRRGTYAVRPRAHRVLVVMGGTDPVGLTAPCLDLLGRTGLELEVTAVVPDPAAAERCTAVAARHPGLTASLVAPLEDLPGVALEHDLVVSAAGTTSWELCCLGVPAALVCAVDNQRAGYDRLVAAGAVLGLGDAVSLVEEPPVERLCALLADADARRALSGAAAALVDGRGAWRLVRAWEALTPGERRKPPTGLVRVRPALESDARVLWAWRNDPATRASSVHPELVPLADHLAWLESSLRRDDRVLLMGAVDGDDVGTVRWDRVAPDAWEVSITVAPEHRGRSLAPELLAAGESELVRRTGRPVTLLATVHEGNAASRRLFAAAGYLPDRPADERGFLGYARQLAL